MIFWRELVGSVQGAFSDRRGTIAREHFAASPAAEQHQVALVYCLGEHLDVQHVGDHIRVLLEVPFEAR